VFCLGACGAGDKHRPAPAPREPAQGAPPANRAVAWATGDGADGSTVARRLARRIAADRPDRFLYLGDVYPSGTALDYRRRFVPIYGRLANITSPTTGNHEWGNRESGYRPYWHGVTGRRQSYWYARPLAGWEIISLSSEARHDADSPQLRWLRKRVEAPGTCRLAFWHRPRFSAGTVHGDAPDVAPFWKALRGHARLVLGGHDHLLQRFRMRAGITEYVAGAGGIELYGRRRDSRLAFARSGVTGALRIVLQPGRARMQFVSVDGKVLDTSRATCSPRSP
jgi:calcineurin-like phosphoesterase family protein